MKSYLTYRNLNLLLAILAAIGMVFAVEFLQEYKGLEPCPLCMLQRFGLVTMGVFTFAAALINPRNLWLRLVLWAGSLAGILWSLGVAARHVWLQNLPPDKVPSCGAGWEFMVSALPWQEVVSQVLSGSGECAEISWTFLGMSIPMQSLIFFSVLTLINVLVGVRIWQAK